MSLEPLRVSGGRKFADGLATFMAWMNVPAGFPLPAFTLLLLNPTATDPVISTLLLLALTFACVAVFIALGQLFINLALGTIRTGGSATRFFRYQFGALGCGVSIGFGFMPAMFESGPLGWILGIAAGLIVLSISLLAFRQSTCRPQPQPPHPGIALAEGIVVDHWNGGMGKYSAPQLAVVQFADELGRARFALHLVQRDPTILGTVGQVQLDPHSGRVRRFIAFPQASTRGPFETL